MAWYGLVLLCAVISWQTVVLLASAYMFAMRNDHLKRFQVRLNLVRNLLVAGMVSGAFLVLNLSGHERAYVRCNGWNVWALVSMPRAIWLVMLIYDLTHLLQDRGGWRRGTFRVLAFMLAVVYTLACYMAMAFYGQAYMHQSSGACYSSVGVEALHTGFSGAMLCLALLVVLTPVWELRTELFHRRVLRVGGVSLVPILSGHTQRRFEPTTFDELNRWMRAERIRAVRERRHRRALKTGSSLLDVNLEGLDESAFVFQRLTPQLLQPALDSGSTDLEQLLGEAPISDDNTQDSEAALAQTVATEEAILAQDPSASWQDIFIDLDVDFFAMQEFDRRSRLVCLYAVVASALMLPLMMHAGAWTFHIAWRVGTFALFAVPLLYWQWYSAVRPSLLRAIGNESFLRGATCVQNAQIKLMRVYLNHFDYRVDLTEYVSACKEAEFRDAARVDQFLRVPYRQDIVPLDRSKDTITPVRRDRYLEMQIWLAVIRRKQLEDPLERDAAAHAIFYEFFQPYSRMNPRLPAEASTVSLCTGLANDHMELFDELLVALTPRLEPREDAHQISAAHAASQQRE